MKFPKPDRSNFQLNLSKTADNDVIDISWGEGTLSDGRPFRVEYWAQDGISSLTYFLSAIGIEEADNDFFRRLLEAENLLEFVTEKRYVAASKWSDASGNELWSVNVVIGDEDELYARDSIPMKRYPRP